MRSNGLTLHDVYVKHQTLRDTRRKRFIWDHTARGEHPGVKYASVFHIDDMTVSLHSTAAMYSPPAITHSFLDTLRGFENQTLWKHLVLDGNGEWIKSGILAGTLCIVSERLNQKDISTSISSAGVQIYCVRSKQYVKVSVAEKSEAASNYRGEILGSLLVMLLLNSATVERDLPYQAVKVYFDNRGVLTHGNSPSTSLCEKQTQADLLRLLKQLVRQSPLSIDFEWVEGHAVEAKGWKRFTLPEKLNDGCDKLAKALLLSMLLPVENFLIVGFHSSK